MKKIILVIILFLIGISKVYAYDTVENFHFGKKVPDVTVRVINGNNTRNTTIWMIYRSDNNYVYCIDPFTNETDGNYEGYIGYNEVFNLSKEQINRMNLLSYYGYGYLNHTDIKWYGITQYLIWETLGFNDIYYTDSLYGNKIDKNIDEINELNNLVNNHFITPSFNIDSNYSIDEFITLTDNNNVLNQYDIEHSSDIFVTKEDNKLIISSNKEGTYTIKFIKKSNLNNDYMLYQRNTRQNMIYPGKFDDVVSSIDINFISGSIEINKQDRETITSQGQATFKDALYGLYKDDNLIKEISLDSNGYGKVTNLPLGNYYIKEITPSTGYMLDNTKYEVNLTNTNQNVIVYEDVIKNKIKIIKKYGNEILNNYYLESDVSFELYDNNNELIDTYITDNSGEINLLLPYGNYTLKQINGMNDFTINDVIKINVDEIDKEQEIEILDKEIVKKGSLEIKKIGSDGKLLDGVEFKLFAKNDIVSPNGNIYYKANDYITDVTINNGYGYINDLYYGSYYLKEISTESGYLLNNDIINVEINNDINNIELINELYEIPNTSKNETNYLKTVSNIFMILGIIILYETKKLFNNN